MRDIHEEAEAIKELLPRTAADLAEMAMDGIDTIAGSNGLLSFAAGFSVSKTFDARDGSQLEIKLTIGAPSDEDDGDA